MDLYASCSSTYLPTKAIVTSSLASERSARNCFQSVSSGALSGVIPHFFRTISSKC